MGKKELFENFLQTKDRRTYEIYNRKNTEVKRRINEAIKEDDRWESRLIQVFKKKTRKCFGRRLKRK